MRSAWLAGLVVAVGVAVVLGGLRSTLEVGVFAVSAIGGFLIGWSVRRGAWQLPRHRPSSRPELAGAVLALVAWLLGLMAAWVVAQAILPGSERSLPERLATTPWLDWLLPQLGAADVLSLVLLVVLGLVGARSAGVPEGTQH